MMIHLTEFVLKSQRREGKRKEGVEERREKDVEKKQ